MNTLGQYQLFDLAGQISGKRFKVLECDRLEERLKGLSHNAIFSVTCRHTGP